MSKKRKQYQNDPKVIDIVKDCVGFRLKEKETLEKLTKHGYEMDVRTLRRIKKKLPKQKRLDILAEEGASQFIIESLDDFHEMRKEADQIVKSTDNPFAKLQAINLKTRIRKMMADFYDAAPVVAALSKRDDDGTLEKH